MSRFIGFDLSLPRFVQLIIKRLSAEAVSEGVFLREASGKLTFIYRGEGLDRQRLSRLSREAVDLLGAYVDADGLAVCTPEDLFDASLREADIGLRQRIDVEGNNVSVRILDRRVVGGDWLKDAQQLAETPRLVFSSLKGGVGRSTALCVLAAALAGQGKRVLAIDMDVEAPGIGTMLLSEATLPSFGLLDYLVETNVENANVTFMSDLVSPSWLSGGNGTIAVLPVLGALSYQNPSNVLSKIARAYLDVPEEVGGAGGTSEKLARLLKYLDEQAAFDVVLIDSRAGLHETSAAAILGSGAKVLFFGVNQSQTFAAYDLLFSGLSLLNRRDWNERIGFVHAKASGSAESIEYFAKTMRERAVAWLSEAHPEMTPSNLESLKDVFQVEWLDADEAERRAESVIDAVDDAEAFPVSSILDSDAFREFDPVRMPDLLNRRLYEAVFGDFLETAFEMLGVGWEAG